MWVHRNAYGKIFCIWASLVYEKAQLGGNALRSSLFCFIFSFCMWASLGMGFPIWFPGRVFQHRKHDSLIFAEFCLMRCVVTWCMYVWKCRFIEKIIHTSLLLDPYVYTIVHLSPYGLWHMWILQLCIRDNLASAAIASPIPEALLDSCTYTVRPCRSKCNHKLCFSGMAAATSRPDGIVMPSSFADQFASPSYCNKF